jgi:RNA polymerase sigma-70 factor, ECF subfamily
VGRFCFSGTLPHRKNAVKFLVRFFAESLSRFVLMFGEAHLKSADEDLLIIRARSGDTHAFATLCERHRQRVWRVVATVTRGGADTDDLAQDAIVRAYGALKTYRGEASFEAWLCRIALNAAHDYYRSAWRRRVLLWDRTETTTEENVQPSEICPSPHGEAERREVQRRVRKAVAALGEKERVPIWLIYFEEFTLAEVARLESVPESTVRSRVQAGLKRLQRTLGDLNFSADDEDNLSAAAPRTASAKNAGWEGCRA